MDDHGGGLVDDRQEGVLIEDIERNVLGDRFGVTRFRLLDADHVAVTDAVAGLGGLAVDHDSRGLDDALDHGTAEVGEQTGQVQVEANAVDLEGAR